MGIQINLFHLLIIGPLFLSIDYYRDNVNVRMRKLLLSLLGFASVLILFFVPWPIKELGWSSWYNIISISHYFIWIWLFSWIAYTGLNREDGLLDSWMYPLLRWLGMMVIGIHGYLLFKNM